ncbi:MAG: carboxypeptidase M32, partial [Anaerolineae bacterium]
VLGRIRAFWVVWYPRLQATFAPHFDTLPFDTFYGAHNESKPSLIRVEADEVTYGLHIMLRYRLERALFSGALAAADLPAAWNSAMEELLGLTPPTDSDGVLQDIHWSQGYFGYFPTYLLGSIFASQLWIAMQADLPDMHAQIATGDYAAILEWMRTTIHQHGKKFTFEQLVERATGGPLDWQPYMHYLAEKYGAIYGL